ncbi:MAG: GNAT family N-acetyltransferase [Bdellovibrionales bacterium]|nr:GNAT family N-acetyltransferase [Bdellovibrionales bacterium]
MDLKLVSTTENDEAILRALHHEAYRDVVERQFGAWDQALQDGFFKQKWDPNAIKIIHYQNKTVGYLIVERNDDNITLSEIVIQPRYQGLGIGSSLLQDLISEAVSSQLPLRLLVLKKNHAKNLYQRLGFKDYDSTDTHYCMELA